MVKGTVSDYVNRISESGLHKAEKTMRKLDVTASQSRILLDLMESEKGAFSVSDAQNVLGVTQPTATGVVTRLERNGLIKSYNPKADRRIKLFKLTAKGKRATAKLSDFIEEFDEQMLEGFSKKERREFIGYIERVYNNFCE